MKVLILWADMKSANLGVRVLAEGTKRLVADAVGEVEFSFQDFSTMADVGLLSTAEIGKGFVGMRSKLDDYFNGFDLVVDTGAGDSFTDIYGMDRFLRRTHAHRVAGRFGRPFVLGPQTIGPFQSKLGRKIARHSMSRVDTILARDSASADCVQGLLDRPARLTTDVVFALEAPPKSRERDVVVNVSGLLWNRNAHVDYKHYRSECSYLIQRLIDGGRSVTLLAHVLDNPTPDNDLVAIRDLLAHFDTTLEVVIPDDLESARATIAGANALVGARMHACLNALSLGVPAVPWAYSRKFAPLMTDLGWGEAIDIKKPTAVAETTLAVLERWRIAPPAADVLALRTRVEPKLADARNAIKLQVRDAGLP